MIGHGGAKGLFNLNLGVRMEQGLSDGKGLFNLGVRVKQGLLDENGSA